MRVYTVHLRHPVLDPERDIQLVPEAFSWFAFFFSVLWALWHRLWLLAAGLLIVELVIGAIVSEYVTNMVASTAVSVGVSVLIGLFANDLRRFFLDHAGYLEVAVVAGDSREDAERRYYDSYPRIAAEALR